MKRIILAWLLSTAVCFGQCTLRSPTDWYLPKWPGWTDTNRYNFLLEGQTTNTYGFLDTSGNGLIASNVGMNVTQIIAGTNQLGRVEYAMAFVPANTSHFIVADNNLLSFTTASSVKPFTFYLWIAITNGLTTDAGYFMKQTPDAGTTEYRCYSGALYLQAISNQHFDCDGDITVQNQYASGLPATNEWVLMTWTCNGGKRRDMKLYFNTNLVSIGSNGDTNQTYSGMSNTTAPLYIGRRNGYFGGLMGTFAILPYELSSNSIVEIYNNTHPTNNLRVR